LELRLDHVIGTVLKVKFMAFDPSRARAILGISANQTISQAAATANSESVGSSGASASTLDECAKVLAVLNDPQQAAKALAEIKAAIADLTARQADAVAKESANTAQLAQLVATQQAQNARSADLDAREATLGRRATENDVASAALQERETKISAREVAVRDGEAKLAADSKTLASKIASYKAALSA
jgi:hypothetical protein